jgi:hypothetical protein
MTQRKDDFDISLFGLPKCHFAFSQDDIARMRGFKRNYERIVETDFIKQRMNETPIVLAGRVDKAIPEALWSDFNEKFRQFILNKDPHYYFRVKRIAFRHPRKGPTKEVRRKMDRMIDHQEKVAHEAYENDGMFNFQMASGEVISAFEMWNKYVYTYNFHVNWMPNHEHRAALDAFGFNPDNPNARAHLASCLIIKMAAFDRVYDHVCDILFFIDNPKAEVATYAHQSRPYPTESFVEDKAIEFQKIKDKIGYCLLGDNNVGPFESIGPVKLSVVTRGTEIKEWKYRSGFHVLSDIVSELTSAEAHIEVQAPDGLDASARLLKTAGSIVVRGDKFIFRADLLQEPRSRTGNRLTLALNGETAELVLCNVGSRTRHVSRHEAQQGAVATQR